MASIPPINHKSPDRQQSPSGNTGLLVAKPCGHCEHLSSQGHAYKRKRPNICHCEGAQRLRQSPTLRIKRTVHFLRRPVIGGPWQSPASERVRLPSAGGGPTAPSQRQARQYSFRGRLLLRLRWQLTYAQLKVIDKPLKNSLHCNDLNHNPPRRRWDRAADFRKGVIS